MWLNSLHCCSVFSQAGFGPYLPTLLPAWETLRFVESLFAPPTTLISWRRVLPPPEMFPRLAALREGSSPCLPTEPYLPAIWRTCLMWNQREKAFLLTLLRQSPPCKASTLTAPGWF